MAYLDYLELRDQQCREAAQKTMPAARYRMFQFVEQRADAIRDGTLEDKSSIQTEGGFAEAWGAPGQPGRVAWLGRFDAHTDVLWEEAQTHARHHRHPTRRVAIHEFSSLFKGLHNNRPT